MKSSSLSTSLRSTRTLKPSITAISLACLMSLGLVACQPASQDAEHNEDTSAEHPTTTDAMPHDESEQEQGHDIDTESHVHAEHEHEEHDQDEHQHTDKNHAEDNHAGHDHDANRIAFHCDKNANLDDPIAGDELPQTLEVGAFYHTDSDPATAHLLIDGLEYDLTQVPSASGAKYSTEAGVLDGFGMSWHSKGNEQDAQAVLSGVVLDHTANPDDAPVWYRCKSEG